MVRVRTINYEATGLALQGTLAVPDGAGPFPGVLIGHEGPGLDDVQRARAADIAVLGYVGMAIDYHGPHAPFGDRDQMMGRHKANHIQVAYAPTAEAADTALAAKAAAFRELGIDVYICGDRNGLV